MRLSLESYGDLTPIMHPPTVLIRAVACDLRRRLLVHFLLGGQKAHLSSTDIFTNMCKNTPTQKQA